MLHLQIAVLGTALHRINIQLISGHSVILQQEAHTCRPPLRRKGAQHLLKLWDTSGQRTKPTVVCTLMVTVQSIFGYLIGLFVCFFSAAHHLAIDLLVIVVYSMFQYISFTLVHYVVCEILF